ncbi:MAG: hypothetical protein HRT50_04715 [Colwellia sp.]|uniref:hypothetical protein n=1 Tax=Colwellia sp. TaxID=56799 RepID=UPI001DE52583|nr:hypothetical protein [Colwellia sp.]NQY48395.1 hypothetical protein [Colwellia sp.]
MGIITLKVVIYSSVHHTLAKAKILNSCHQKDLTLPLKINLLGLNVDSLANNVSSKKVDRHAPANALNLSHQHESAAAI